MYQIPEFSIELIPQIVETISKCEFDIIEPTINRLFTQTSCEFINPSHSDYMCKLYEPECVPELYIDYKEKYNPKVFNSVIQCVYEDTLMMKMFSINTMEEYIQLNSSNRYIFIPILLSSPYGNSKKTKTSLKKTFPNLTYLIIDNHSLSVYFLDCSGWTNFFDTNNKPDDKPDDKPNGIQVIEKIFKKYFNDLSIETRLTYKYISVIEWNPKNYNILPNITNINSFSIDNYYFNEIIGIMFCHYLCSNQLNSVENTLNYLVNLDNDEKIQMCIEYTKIFYQEILLTSNELGIDIIKLNVDKVEIVHHQEPKNNIKEKNYIIVESKNIKISLETYELDEIEKELLK